MANVIIGSARIDERGKLSGGAAGDQKQSGTNDYKGEVSLQTFYNHKKGWYILRLKSNTQALSVAKKMLAACNNPNIGYDQSQRLGVITNGTNSKVKTECDCSSLVRACVKEATGIDPGNFNTASEVSALEKTNLFQPKVEYKQGIPLYSGDILVTKTKGHTAIVVEGEKRSSGTSASAPVSMNNYYPKCKSTETSIVTALNSVGVDSSFEYRKKIATANGISGYKGTATQNINMLDKLKKGILIKA